MKVGSDHFCRFPGVISKNTVVPGNVSGLPGKVRKVLKTL